MFPSPLPTVPRPFDLDALLTRLRRHSPALDSDEPGRRAAVAAVLRQNPVTHSADLLFIRRAEHPRDPWSGQMAFPGGRRDRQDRTLADTAVRETHEELGFDLRTKGSPLTRLPDLPAIAEGRRMGLVIAPFVFALHEDVEFKPDPLEVAETVWIPIEALADSANEDVHPWTWRGREYRFPCVRYQGRVIWGLTHQMLHALFGRFST